MKVNKQKGFINCILLKLAAMNRILILYIFLFVFIGFPVTNSFSSRLATARHQKIETYVYICDSRTAYAYHSSENCSGLNRCSHKILKITLDEAINKYHRKPCKICERQ